MIVYKCLIPRAKHELSYMDEDGEAFENDCYYDIMERIRCSQLGCHCFWKLFRNVSTTIEELVLIFYNSIQAHFNYKSNYNSIYPKHYDFCNANVCHSLYYSTEYDDDYDD